MAAKKKYKHVRVEGYEVPAHHVPGHTRKVKIKAKHKKK